MFDLHIAEIELWILWGKFKVRWGGGGGVIVPEPRFAPYFLVRFVFLSKCMSRGLRMQKENHGFYDVNIGPLGVFWGTSD